MSSNPTTETSSGTCRPASRKARIAPMAEISLKEKKSGESCPRSQQHFGGHVSELRRRRIALQLRYDAGIDSQTKMLSNALDVGPSHLVSELNSCPLMNAIWRWPRCDGPTSSALLSIFGLTINPAS